MNAILYSAYRQQSATHHNLGTKFCNSWREGTLTHVCAHDTFLSVDNGRNMFESNHITRNSREMLVPNPFGGFLVSLDTTHSVGRQCLDLLVSGHGTQSFGESRPDDQHVAILEFDILEFRNFLNIIDENLVVVEQVVLDTASVGIGFVIDQDAASDQSTTSMPICGKTNY